MIGDMLLISVEVPDVKFYEDLSKQRHEIFHCGPPFDMRDLLVENKRLRENIDYPNGKVDIILDIDLDFFTFEDEESRAGVIAENNFKDFFAKDSFIWWVYKRAKLLTLSKEPHYCGGIGNSERIIQLLYTYFLNL